MPEQKSLILSDESVNRYKFRVLSDGIEFIDDEIPMFYNHDHEQGELPIGKLTNLRVENGQLLADPVWDEDDNKAMKVKSKVDKGFIKGASIGFDVLETSVDPSVLLEGQTHATVTKCLLVEASPTPMRANIGARFLSKNGKRVTLSVDNDDELKDVLPSVEGIKETKQVDTMSEKLLTTLGLPSTATEAQVIEAINKLNGDRVEALITLGKQKGVINATNENVYRLSAKADYAGTLKTLDATPAPVAPVVEKVEVPAPVAPATTNPSDEHPVTLSALISAMKSKDGEQEPAERLGAKFLRLSKEDDKELARIKRETPDVYNKMASDYAKMLNV